MPLLLHLIKCEDMDIFNINIHEITKQYLDYIKSMKQLDIEVAGDFISMASSLVYIKSRMLLPQYNDEGEEVEAEDPRQELAKKLWEYQNFQQAAQKLYTRPLVNRDLFLRGKTTIMKSDPLETDEGIIIEEDNALFSLISNYRRALRNMNKGVHKVSREFQSVGERILEMKNRLLVGQQIGMNQLIDRPENRADQVLITFLSLMELAKMGFISLFQSNNFEEIYIHTHHAIDRNVLQRVENYDATAILDDLTSRETSELNIDLQDDKTLDSTVTTEIEDGEQLNNETPATDEEIVQEESLLDLDSKSDL